jgi:hypothetical protein
MTDTSTTARSRTNHIRDTHIRDTTNRWSASVPDRPICTAGRSKRIDEATDIVREGRYLSNNRLVGAIGFLGSHYRRSLMLS